MGRDFTNDGYAAYNDIGGPKLVRVGCWAHARRKFVDGVKVHPHDAAAIAMVTRMDALFLIDRDAAERGRVSMGPRIASMWIKLEQVYVADLDTPTIEASLNIA